MSQHKRQLKMACPCGRNLLRASWDPVAERVDTAPMAGATVEVFWPGRGARAVYGPSGSLLVDRRSSPVDASLPVVPGAHPDDVSYSARCRCGKVHAITGARVSSLWFDANEAWETTHDPRAWALQLP